MARRTVVEVQCSRCDRKELVQDGGGEVAVINGPPVPTKALIVRVGDGTAIEFEDLCSPCMGAVKSHLEAIGKKIEGLSPERKKTKDAEAVEGKKEREAKKKKGPDAAPSPSAVSAPSLRESK